MSEPLPQLHADSADDICLSKQGSCVILLSESEPTQEQVDLMSEVHGKVSSNLDGRGPQFSFMWANPSTQPEFTSIFGVTEYPRVVILRVGKKVKFLVHDETAATVDGLSNTLNKVIGGDAKFDKHKGNLPNLAKLETE